MIKPKKKRQGDVVQVAYAVMRDVEQLANKLKASQHKRKPNKDGGSDPLTPR